MAGNLSGAPRAAVVRDAKFRRQQAERAAESPPQELAARNACILALAELPDPRQALRVCQAIERSILEFIATRRGGSAG